MFKNHFDLAEILDKLFDCNQNSSNDHVSTQLCFFFTKFLIHKFGKNFLRWSIILFQSFVSITFLEKKIKIGCKMFRPNARSHYWKNSHKNHWTEKKWTRTPVKKEFRKIFLTCYVKTWEFRIITCVLNLLDKTLKIFYCLPNFRRKKIVSYSWNVIKTEMGGRLKFNFIAWYWHNFNLNNICEI